MAPIGLRRPLFGAIAIAWAPPPSVTLITVQLRLRPAFLPAAPLERPTMMISLAARYRLTLFVLAAVCLVPTTGVRAEDKPNSATQPVSKEGEKWWKDRHESFNERAKKGGV